jgi:hypothetical protein
MQTRDSDYVKYVVCKTKLCLNYKPIIPMLHTGDDMNLHCMCNHCGFHWHITFWQYTHVHYIKFLSVVNLGKSSLIHLSWTEHQFCVQKNLVLIHKVPLYLIKVSGWCAQSASRIRRPIFLLTPLCNYCSNFKNKRSFFLASKYNSSHHKEFCTLLTDCSWWQNKQEIMASLFTRSEPAQF